MYSAGIRHCPAAHALFTQWRCDALQNITEVVHDVRTNRNFSRRVPDERIAEFHLFAQDFNSLLDEMEEWQLRLPG
ncbi:hypothetical protein JS565_11635 [Salmonella enterica subsp. enterica serovar Senftenberg]|nr:hypothetical protein [Salmonella enterica subsp. enterica serovar Senftenberg]